MDIHEPIESVIPSLDGPVLGALCATSAPLNLTEVTRRAGRGTPSGVRNVLLRLADQGIVHQVPGGYVLNRDHVAADAILALSSLHNELIDRIRKTIQGWNTAPLLSGLFGSAARRDGDSSSDIDLLIVSKEQLDLEADDLAERIHAWSGNPAHITVRTPADLARLQAAGEPILSSWRTDLIVITGDRSVLKDRQAA